MSSIVKASISDFKLLADLGSQTFIESHGKSASKADIDFYIGEKYNYKVIQQDLRNADNIYHIIYYENQPIGFSKMILDNPTSNIQMGNVSKLERLYLLKDFHKLKKGLELFNFNVALSKSKNQIGMWLYVWKENERAISFYMKNEFQIIGSYDFQISERHSNPNHQLFLKY